MQDFEIRIASGVSVNEWLDSRINSIVGFPQRHYVGHVGTPIVLHAVVGGVDAPLDSALGGRLFIAWRVETSYVFPIATPAGQSSIQSFTPEFVGHYTIGMAREEGGAVLIHVDVEVDP